MFNKTCVKTKFELAYTFQFNAVVVISQQSHNTSQALGQCYW